MTPPPTGPPSRTDRHGHGGSCREDEEDWEAAANGEGAKLAGGRLSMAPALSHYELFRWFSSQITPRCRGLRRSVLGSTDPPPIRSSRRRGHLAGPVGGKSRWPLAHRSSSATALCGPVLEVTAGRGNTRTPLRSGGERMPWKHGPPAGYTSTWARVTAFGPGRWCNENNLVDSAALGCINGAIRGRQNGNPGYKDHGSIAAEIKMTRTVHNGAVLLVEGEDDVRFWTPRSLPKND